MKNKILNFLNFFPNDEYKQFLKVIFPIYFILGSELLYLFLNGKYLFYGEITLETLFVYYFLLPVVTLILPICLMISSIQLIKRFNFFIIIKEIYNIKRFFTYMFSVFFLFSGFTILFIYFCFCMYFLELKGLI